MSEQIKLLDCPFCGGDDVGLESTITEVSASCADCCANIHRWQTHTDDQGTKDVVAAWNTRPATREPVGADDVIDLLKVPLGKSINITVEDNDEKLVKQNRSQFDNCPGCNNFWDLEMVNCTMDDPEFIVICRPCGWMARGETIEQAMFNWNRRATRHAAERERALRAEVERLTAALTDIKNYALDKQQWAIANTAELVLGEHADFTANIASATGQDEQGEGK